MRDWRSSTMMTTMPRSSGSCSRASHASTCDCWRTASCPTTSIFCCGPRGRPPLHLHALADHDPHPALACPSQDGRHRPPVAGPVKSFPVQSDEHFLTVCRYVERNALRANLVKRAEQWNWGSLSARRAKDGAERPTLTPWPIQRPHDWTARVNRRFGPKDEEAILRSMQRGQRFGSESWRAEQASRLGLESLLRPRDRPRK
jgi:hypothetical protein